MTDVRGRGDALHGMRRPAKAQNGSKREDLVEEGWMRNAGEPWYSAYKDDKKPQNKRFPKREYRIYPVYSFDHSQIKWEEGDGMRKIFFPLCLCIFFLLPGVSSAECTDIGYFNNFTLEGVNTVILYAGSAPVVRFDVQNCDVRQSPVINLFTEPGKEDVTGTLLASGKVEPYPFIGPLKEKSVNSLVQLMEAGEAYVTIQTKKHPEGEIRGQIR